MKYRIFDWPSIVADDQSIHEIDEKDTVENSCGDRSDDEDQNDKWNFYDQHESTRGI